MSQASLQQIVLYQQVFYPRQESQQRFGFQTLGERLVFIGSFKRVQMPLAGFPIYSKDALVSFDQCQVEGAGHFTQEGLHEEVGPDVQPQREGKICPFCHLQRLHESYLVQCFTRFGPEVVCIILIGNGFSAIGVEALAGH